MRFSPGHSENGFTLLEILVAILIFGIVMSSLFVSFRSLMFEPAGIESLLEKEETARTALYRIVADLEAMHVSLPPYYRPPKTEDESHPYRLEGEIDFVGSREFGRLRFSSFAHLPLRGSQQRGIAQIVYYIQADENDRYSLRRADDLEPYPEPETLFNDAVLCEEIERLTFLFLDEEGEIHETWHSEEEALGYAMPTAIRIRLEMKGEENPHVLETQVVLPVRREKTG